ncbi:DUF2391 family protein [archaeon]|jgi:uncharacterized membrane protein|nr:DUF2391 family protein [archaeon]MBT4241585.1 DUF2391 family protein [archaeon]MBT4417980.1 DUF2391 family protein [archaeon]
MKKQTTTTLQSKKSIIKKTASKKPTTKKPTPKKQDETTFKGLMEPPRAKFGLRNILQAIIGAIVLAIPIGFTEETWKLGEMLPLWNVMLILLASLFFITLFAYRKLSRTIPNFEWDDLVKRIFLTYIISFVIVAVLLSIIQKADWINDFILAFKRTVIVTLPASLSATIAGSLK